MHLIVSCCPSFDHGIREKKLKWFPDLQGLDIIKKTVQIVKPRVAGKPNSSAFHTRKQAIVTKGVMAIHLNI